MSVHTADGPRTEHSKVGNVAFDCDDVIKVAHFWSAVLGRQLDEASTQEFASMANRRPQNRACVVFQPRRGGQACVEPCALRHDRSGSVSRRSAC